jgi:hypothetical protein
MFSDGRVVIGWWADDKRHGIGIISYADGSKAAVTCDNDEVVSEVRGLLSSTSLILMTTLKYRS